MSAAVFGTGYSMFFSPKPTPPFPFGAVIPVMWVDDFGTALERMDYWLLPAGLRVSSIDTIDAHRSGAKP